MAEIARWVRFRHHAKYGFGQLTSLGISVYDGEMFYDIVIGKTCTAVTPDEADAFIFGYTCTNDVTAADILNRDPTFAQWARAKGFDGYGPFGPVIATGLDPAGGWYAPPSMALSARITRSRT